MNVKPPVTPSTGDESRAGFFFALSAFLIWGVLALFWKATSHIDAVEVTAHRVVWSLPVAVAILWAMGRTGDVLPAMRSPRKLGILFICATIISLNWGVFIWAISVDRTIDTALAYYINPLVSVAMGAIFLGERFNRLQLIAIAIAFCAVLLLSVLSGEVPWISLWLAGTFALYGLLRKTVDVGPAQGFLVEVILMFPFGAIYVLVLLADGASSFLAGSGTDNLLLILAGPATSISLDPLCKRGKKAAFGNHWHDAIHRSNHDFPDWPFHLQGTDQPMAVAGLCNDLDSACILLLVTDRKAYAE